MKNLTMMVFILFTFQSMAGELVNTKTGESIVLSFNAETKSVKVDAHMKYGHLEHEISLETFDKTKKENGDAIKYGSSAIDGTTKQTVFLFSTSVFYEVKHNDETPISFITLPFAVVADTLIMPYRLPRKIVSSQTVKSDLKKLQRLIGSSDAIEVKNRTFKRILNYIPMRVD